MREPVRLSRTQVLAFHEEQLREHGGLSGVGNENALAGALARPPDPLHEERPDLSALAVVYAHRIAKKHPFGDGNKRTAFVCAAVFLGLNGIRLTLPEPRAVEMMLGLASGTLSQEAVAQIIRENSDAIRRSRG